VVTGWRARLALSCVVLLGAVAVFAADPPPAAEIKKQLGDSPITEKSWKDWRGKLVEWAPHYEAARPAFEEAHKFLVPLSDGRGGGVKNKSLQKDHVVYLALGVGYLLEAGGKKAEALEFAHIAFDNALKQQGGKTAAAHYLNGLSLLQREKAKAEPDKKGLGDALAQFELARKLDAPLLKALLPAREEARIALDIKDNRRAEDLLKKAREEAPDDVALARDLAQVINEVRPPRKPDEIKALVEKFPRDGVLAARLAYSYYHTVGGKKEAAVWFKKARDLGADPAKVFGEAELARIEADIKKEDEKAQAAEKEKVAKELEERLKKSIGSPLSGAPEAVPSAAALKKLIDQEPVGYDTWVSWRKRLSDWCVKDYEKTRPAFKAAKDFLSSLQGNDHKSDLKGPLNNDPVAYLVLAMVYLDEAANVQAKVREAEAVIHLSGKAVGDMWQAAKLGQPQLARGYLTRGRAILMKETSKPGEGLGAADHGQLGEAFKQFDEARKFEPGLPGIPSLADMGDEAARAKAKRLAEERFKVAYEAKPDEAVACKYARAVASNDDRAWLPSRTDAIKPLVARFGNNGELLSFYGYVLQLENHPKEAVEQWDKVKGGDEAVSKYGISKDVIAHTRKNAKGVGGELNESISGIKDFFSTLFWWTIVFSATYAGVMVLMCLTGLVLASKTRGPKAMDMLGKAPKELVAQGQVLRTGHETWLSRFYMVALTLALIFFYVAMPFILIGLIIVFVFILLLGLFFRRDRESASMHTAMLKASGGGVFAVIKSLFAGFSKGSFGLEKDRDDCPRLYEVLEEVARKVDTDPVDQVYIAPGSAIGVHQEGRGPFGLFGSKKRVLTLGLSTMHFLTISELKAILAHEYAHFSHSDTKYSRFIYQVSLSIRKAMDGMKSSGGILTYVNPFYWFFYLYSKSYALLSSGFSRSREFLADRMACSLYGADVFSSALKKVCTDGTLFEMTVYKNIVEMLRQKKAFVNMYLAFRKFREEQLTSKERDKLYKKLLADEPSLFDSHPTFKERMDAVEKLPKAVKPVTVSALLLFDQPEEIEKELTDFLTEVMDYIRKASR
jgi:Zn-dependent protease with chaperone function